MPAIVVACTVPIDPPLMMAGCLVAMAWLAASRYLRERRSEWQER